ncbi:MAG TPA: hypothetical protein PKZ08_04390 [Vicinamibacterales bacterium]|nr:hypothetical protein [Vicinamibacterales bacterium]
MGVETRIRTGRPEFDGLFPLVRSILERAALELVIDAQHIRGCRTGDARSIWIRDFSDRLRALRHVEPDVTSAVQHFADTQAASGRIFDSVTTFPERPPSERENWTKYVRVPVEADVEYRFVKAAYLAWQATGDDEWARRLLPSLERAMRYVTGHPWYWDRQRGLVKRPYTIDTWDFAYTAGRHGWLQFQVTDDTYWGCMHGDSSGYVEAFGLMARLHRRLGDARIAARWDAEAATLRAAMNRACWNGRFYTHFVKITPVEVPGVDEGEQLSLSNPMAINRGAADHSQAAAILREYQRRRAEGRAFAEWFSIDPPFPDGVFGDPRLVKGAYVNGGIMPLVGGELARAAFEHGFEQYGIDILRRYYALASERGESFLWYFPDGRPSTVEASTSPEATPADGWGSSAMAWALVEGLAGVVDGGRLFDAVRLSPRWEAAGVNDAEVGVGYAASGAGLEYQYRRRPGLITIDVRKPDGDSADVDWRVLLPHGCRNVAARCDGRSLPVATLQVEASLYAAFASRLNGETHVELKLGGEA